MKKRIQKQYDANAFHANAFHAFHAFHANAAGVQITYNPTITEGAKARGPRTGLLKGLLSGWLTGEFLAKGNMCRQDAIDLNMYIASISALVWFASVTWAVSLKGPFDNYTSMMPELAYGINNDVLPMGLMDTNSFQRWTYLISWIVYLVSVAFSAIACFIGMHNTMVVMQVSDYLDRHAASEFQYFWKTYGKRQLILLGVFFLLGMWTLYLAWMIMIMASMPWPLNLIFNLT